MSLPVLQCFGASPESLNVAVAPLQALASLLVSSQNALDAQRLLLILNDLAMLPPEPGTAFGAPYLMNKRVCLEMLKSCGVMEPLLEFLVANSGAESSSSVKWVAMNEGMTFFKLLICSSGNQLFQMGHQGLRSPRYRISKDCLCVFPMLSTYRPGWLSIHSSSVEKNNPHVSNTGYGVTLQRFL